MKLKIPFLFLVVTILSADRFLIAKHFWGGKTIPTSEVKKKWGDLQFDEESFQKGDASLRAKMAHSLLKNPKKYLGKSGLEIQKHLGPHDGFYYKDVFPAYIIQIGKTKNEESWQIVFELDSKRNVVDIFVHKNCCY